MPTLVTLAPAGGKKDVGGYGTTNLGKMGQLPCIDGEDATALQHFMAVGTLTLSLLQRSWREQQTRVLDPQCDYLQTHDPVLEQGEVTWEPLLVHDVLIHDALLG